MLTHKYGLQHEMNVQRGAESVRNFLSSQLFQVVGRQSHPLESQYLVINMTYHLLIVSNWGQPLSTAGNGHAWSMFVLTSLSVLWGYEVLANMSSLANCKLECFIHLCSQKHFILTFFFSDWFWWKFCNRFNLATAPFSGQSLPCCYSNLVPLVSWLRIHEIKS